MLADPAASAGRAYGQNAAVMDCEPVGWTAGLGHDISGFNATHAPREAGGKASRHSIVASPVAMASGHIKVANTVEIKNTVNINRNTNVNNTAYNIVASNVDGGLGTENPVSNLVNSVASTAAGIGDTCNRFAKVTSQTDTEFCTAGATRGVGACGSVVSVDIKEVDSSGLNPVPHLNREEAKKSGVGGSHEKRDTWLSYTSYGEAPGSLYRVRASDPGSRDCEFTVYDTCASGICSCTHTIGGATSQLLPCRFFVEAFLRGDNDPDWDYILRGVIFGFRVINDNCEASYESSNYSSSTGPLTYAAMSKKLNREIKAGILTVRDEPELCVHPIGTVPKADSVGFRAIIDCSAPKGECVNQFTDECTSKFAYKSVDDVADNLTWGEYMSVVDIADAYRAVSIHPASASRQGLTWQFEEGVTTFIRDNRLCMGLSASPYVFSKISDFVVRCMVRRGHDRVTNYLDDFCIISADYEGGVAAQAELVSTLRMLNFMLNFKKLTTPSTECRFLGIIIDSHQMCLKLPQDKLDKLLRCIRGLYNRRRATKLEIERLAGLIAHCAKVVRGGRTFARRIYDLCGSVDRSYYKVRLNQAFKADLRWWLEFATAFNGYANICPRHSQVLCTYSDASRFGFGATHAGDWLAGQWGGGDHPISLGHHREQPFKECFDDSGDLTHINTLEFWPVLCAAYRWGHHWADRNVVMVTDNTTVLHALNSGRSKNKQIMHWLYDLFWFAICYNFDVSAVYIKSGDNTICDALSRLNEPGAKARICGAIDTTYLCCHSIFAELYAC